MTIKNYFKRKERIKNLYKRLLKSEIFFDKKGNYSIIISAILVISFLILSVVVLNTVLEERTENSATISSNQYQYIIDDYKRNLPLIERQSLEELSEYVINNKKACRNSRDDLKEIIDEELAQKNREYYENYNIVIESHTASIENTSDPFSIKFETYISSVKGDFYYENMEESSVNCYGLKDPVPLLFCGRDSSFKIDYSGNPPKVLYGNSLARFLMANHVENYSFYINASSPFIIKRCPYDPYKHHGDDNGRIMKNCRDNCYYHESADGACYLCRLEGKSGCEHYGFETFINPAVTNETGRVSACGSDHVIFSDDIYPGVEVIYNREDGMNEILYLDPHGHKVKYGMSGY